MIIDLSVALCVFILVATIFVFFRTNLFHWNDKMRVLYDGPQRITYWPTMKESENSVSTVLRMRITTDMVHIMSVRHDRADPKHSWHFQPSTATANTNGDDIVLVTDETTFLIHSRTGDEDLLPLFRHAGIAEHL